MLHLFDASTLITANNLYYPVNDVPEFWQWLCHQAKLGVIKVPIEMIEEVLDGNKTDDPLLAWTKDNKDALLLDEEADPALVNKITVEAYAPDLTDDEIIIIGKDPFLVSYALTNPAERCVVTVEVSAPRKQRANRRIPDVCKQFGVTCHGPFEVYRAFGFKTNWKK